MIHALGAAAERRVWTQFTQNKLHPNLYVFLVGPPGVGKTQAIMPVNDLLRKSKSVVLAPNDCTKQGLLDALADCRRQAMLNGRPFDYHFMAVCISELANFMSKYDPELAGLLIDLFDCLPLNEERKRSGAGKTIDFPGLSFLIGTATQNLGKTISGDMWNSGFMARVICVFSADEVIPENMFAPDTSDEYVKGELVKGLARIGELKGPMSWTEDAQRLIFTFRKTQKDGAPLHNRLEHYVTRRWLHLAKLCMIAALDDERMCVEGDDFHRALSWLTDAEDEMSEMFKDMQSHEDGQIYEELRSAMYGVYMNSRGADNRPRPLTLAALYHYLSTRVSTHQVERVVAIALAADMFRRVAGEEDQYIPQPPRSGQNRGVL